MKQFQKLMMTRNLALTMHNYNETLTDPVLKEKARAVSAIILERLLDESGDDDDNEEEGQQTAENKKKEVPSPEGRARVGVSNATILVDLSKVVTDEPGMSAFHRLFGESKKEEEVASPSTQPEHRTSAFVTDEPDDEPETKKEAQARPQGPERMIHTLIFGRDGCSAVTSESEAAQRKRELSREMGRRMTSSSHHCWLHPQHHKAQETENPNVKLSDLITCSAEQLRDKLVLNYVTEIAKYITDYHETRCATRAVRMIDIDLIPMIKAPFIAKGYKCVEAEQILRISW
jgi:hypothetical protein